MTTNTPNRYHPDYTPQQASARARERVLAAITGVTLTQEDAEVIIEMVRTAVPSVEPKETSSGPEPIK